MLDFRLLVFVIYLILLGVGREVKVFFFGVKTYIKIKIFEK